VHCGQRVALSGIADRQCGHSLVAGSAGAGGRQPYEVFIAPERWKALADEALRIVATYRLLLPRAQLRVCGGRERVFGQGRSRVLEAGASGIMVGDFLTTSGTALADDRADLGRLGFFGG